MRGVIQKYIIGRFAQVQFLIRHKRIAAVIINKKTILFRVGVLVVDNDLGLML